MPSKYEEDPTMRDVAYTALLSRCGWFGDLKMSDSQGVITKFLQDWREAQYRHDSGGQTIWKFAVTWADSQRDAYQREYPYLGPTTPVTTPAAGVTGAGPAVAGRRPPATPTPRPKRAGE